MTGFSPDWLALREPFDRGARSARLAELFASRLPPTPRIVDLGGGTGANIRALAALMPAGTRWRMVDDDPEVIAVARASLAEYRVEFDRRDLAADLEGAIGDAQAITASALADLVSRTWIDRLFAAAADRAAPLLIVLTVDGWHEFSPAHPDDDLVLNAFAQDQRRDKGFGPALGGNAAEYLAAAARHVGFAVEGEASDWQIPSDATAMLHALIEGIAGASSSARPALARRIHAWRHARAASIAAKRLTFAVGHRDVCAYPERRA